MSIRLVLWIWGGVAAGFAGGLPVSFVLAMSHESWRHHPPLSGDAIFYLLWSAFTVTGGAIGGGLGWATDREPPGGPT